MHKIRTIIVDDEPKAIEVLQRYCNDLDTLELKSTFRDPVKAIEYVQKNVVDLIFLDINMPRISGLEFLDILTIKPRIIFTTAYTEYAIESYDYEAVDYLLKPIDFHRFVKAISKTQKLIHLENSSAKIVTNANQEARTIYIKSGPQLYKVDISDILYLEKDGNYLIFYTRDKKMLSRQNMKDIFTILNPADFIRVHKSYVVALKHMEVIESHQIRIGDIKIPVGRNYREDLMKITRQNGDE
ncbi:MAG: response regulator transcription factor [Pricia sp.]|nr:response regulator transcription factor [Pricia sp.]